MTHTLGHLCKGQLLTLLFLAMGWVTGVDLCLKENIPGDSKAISEEMSPMMVSWSIIQQT